MTTQNNHHNDNNNEQRIMTTTTAKQFAEEHWNKAAQVLSERPVAHDAPCIDFGT